ncbi:MAG TPA: ATP-dependent DNA helicase [Aeromicrobium sp.]|nr:ATP-dependent DNA helicase [Aeromicrobium sp.]
MAVQYVRAPERESPRPPTLDDAQQAVVDHPGGPLLVLAGPGTGKSTTLVEVVADRVVNRGFDPDQILVLTFSRKAADDLRGRVASRLTETSAVVDTMTFHSFCYALVRRYSSPEEFVRPVQLMSAPEQEAVIRELVQGSDPLVWPERLRPALRTRGFAAELNGLFGAASVQDLGSDGLAEVARRERRDDWAAAARFFEEYSGVVALQNKSDYTDVVVQAVRLLRDPAVRDEMRAQYRLVVVDEYQDTDPLQVQLLQELAGDGRDLIVVGDPDQAIYAFRGADVRGIVDFPRQFAGASGPAEVIALRTTRRFGPGILEATRAIAQRIGTPGLSADLLKQLRALEPHAERGGDVDVRTYVSAVAEAEDIARLLREAHVTGDPETSIGWGDMAVLVRTSAELGRLERVLVAHGVPVEVAGDEIPLAAESAVRALLAAVRVADHVAHGRPIPVDEALALLTGPIGQLDAADLRRVSRHLRAADRDDPDGPRSSHELLAQALAHPVEVTSRSGSPATVAALDRTRRLGEAVRRAAVQIVDRDGPEQVLWTMFTATDWRARLVAASESGGDGSLRAHRDLDALVALFQRAAWSEETGSKRDIGTLIDDLQAQQIPADTLTDTGVRGTSVRLMTAHRSKGLQWRLVVVAGVQEGGWPITRPNGTVLQRERLGRAGLVAPAPVSARLADERRLFYVACTRAIDRLVVTAVASNDADGEQPSRFVSELVPFVTQGDPQAPRPRPRHPFSLRGVVARLRYLLETTDDPVVRHGAATRLARLADHGTWATRAADPDRWWGTRELTSNDVPVVAVDQPVALSGSTVDGLMTCPLSWFLKHEVHGESGTTAAQGFGSIVHAIAADVVRRASDPDPEQMAATLDRIWSHLEFSAPWIGRRELEQAHAALGRFARWHAERGRTPLAAEHRFRVTIDLDGDSVVIRGSMDRVEIDADGAVHVVDLKTNKHAPTSAEVSELPQLGVYQLAVEHGAVEELAPGARAGGAELVQLRDAAGDLPKVQRQDPPGADEPFFAVQQVAESLRIVRAEDFVATPSEKACGYCAFTTVCPAQAAGATTVGIRQVRR